MFLHYVRQMSFIWKGTSLFVLVLFMAAVAYRLISQSIPEAIGLSQGSFCLPKASEVGDSLILKSLHIAPLFVSRCSNGDLQLDSDLDGLCDRDEVSAGTSPQSRFSRHSAVSDRVWQELTEDERLQISQLGESCDNSDQDADLLTNCEELLLQSKRYEALSDAQTESLYSLASLNINHPDTDADGFIDGVELRLVNRVAPFVYSNEESGVVDAEILLEEWRDRGKTENIQLMVQSLKEREGCFSYEVYGLDSWLPQLDDFASISDQSQSIKLDFIIYALLSTNESPAESAYYATRIISAELRGKQLIDSPVMKGFKFVKIQSEVR